MRYTTRCRERMCQNPCVSERSVDVIDASYHSSIKNFMNEASLLLTRSTRL